MCLRLGLLRQRSKIFIAYVTKYQELKAHLPANRILIKSNGCKINVDVTPPDIPATMCSYLTCENKVTFRLEPLLLIAAIAVFGIQI